MSTVFVERDGSGSINGVYANLQPGRAEEEIAADHPSVLAYLNPPWRPDAIAPAFLVAVVGGGAVKSPVFDDGAKWVAF